MDLQNDGLEFESADTPLSKNRFSDDTLNILKEASAKLEKKKLDQDSQSTKKPEGTKVKPPPAQALTGVIT